MLPKMKRRTIDRHRQQLDSNELDELHCRKANHFQFLFFERMTKFESLCQFETEQKTMKQRRRQ